MFLFPEGGLSPDRKDFRDRFAILLANNRVGIAKTKAQPARDFAADRRLPRPHKTDQDDISDRLTKIHISDTIADTRRCRQLLSFYAVDRTTFRALAPFS